MIEENARGHERIISVLTEELERARQGKISDLLLIAMGQDYGSSRVEIFSKNEPETMLQRLKEMEQWLKQDGANGNSEPHQ